MIDTIHVSRSTHDISVATYYNLKGSYILYRTESCRIDGRSTRRLFSTDAIDRQPVDSVCVVCCKLVVPPGDGRGSAPKSEPAAWRFLINCGEL